MSRFLRILLPVLCCATAIADGQIQFNRDIRPILAAHCWKCHGFDPHSRQADLRLDDSQASQRPAASGATAVVPHDPEHSELVRRILSTDADIQMPPESAARPLTAVQKDLLVQWIRDGAAFQKHWAFEPLRKPSVPQNGRPHPIDAFLAEKHLQLELSPAPAASRMTLLRRVSLDLTGLPPSLEDLNQTDESWEETVDRLLNSPHFGERMAVDWLDAARYADTNGYFSDKPRQMWLWRDWVINAFNSNMPFDQFTIEQLAGDLLPSPSTDQRIATGFNRNHVANNETGIIDEEFRTEYVVDRVDTTMTTWMGLTVGCAQCHDHKYDPVSQKEFYQLFAVFNNVPEKGLIVTDNPPPVLTVASPEQQSRLASLTQATAEAAAKFEAARQKLAGELTDWETRAFQEMPQPPSHHQIFTESFSETTNAGISREGTTLRFQPGVRGMAGTFDATQHLIRPAADFDPDAPWTIGLWLLPDGSLSCPISMIEPNGDRRGIEVLWQKGRLTINLVSRWGVHAIEMSTVTRMEPGRWHQVIISFDGRKSAEGVRVFLNGQTCDTAVHRDSLNGSLKNQRPFLIGRRDEGLGYYGAMDELRILQQSINAETAAAWFRAEKVRGALERPRASRSSHDIDTILDDYIQYHGSTEIRADRESLKQAQRDERHYRDSIPTTLVMEELPEPRTTRVLVRGQYDQPGETVLPDIPAALGTWPSDAPRNRLGLAKWLVSTDNPLTARVAVNRLWKQCFGEGLVRTANDFGSQGEPPDHPELLDWLAVKFRESGWDIKALLKLIVTSQAYQRDSSLPFAAADMADPQNRWLARGPAFRLPAEMIRDQALAASGLLQRRIGGPSVRPYQPPGLWEEVSYNAEDTYEQDVGEGLWRRSLYTFLKRQVPPPAFLTFDGITREKCTVQRARTNTPLQALVLLNDPTYVEAARVMAIHTLQLERTDAAILNTLFRRIVCRDPDQEESRQLLSFLDRQRSRFQTSDESALELLQVGASPIPDSVTQVFSASEIAAWTMVAHTLLNLDEAITRR